MLIGASLERPEQEVGTRVPVLTQTITPQTPAKAVIFASGTMPGQTSRSEKRMVDRYRSPNGGGRVQELKLGRDGRPSAPTESVDPHEWGVADGGSHVIINGYSSQPLSVSEETCGRSIPTTRASGP